jgi:hypothetical protein
MMNNDDVKTETAVKPPWTVLDVAAGLGEERARELINEHMELRQALRQYMRIGHGNSMSHELQAAAYNNARDLLDRISGPPRDLLEYVNRYAVRGACTCDRCIDAPADAAAQQPVGHTVDLTFFKVAARGGSKDEFLTHVRNEFPGWLDGREHSYIEVGGDVCDQGHALLTIGLGHVLGAWRALTPDTLMPDAPADLKQQMAAQGFIGLQAKL